MNRLICLIFGHRKPPKVTDTIKADIATKTAKVLCRCTRCGKEGWATITGIPDSYWEEGPETPEDALACLLGTMLGRMLARMGEEKTE